MSVNKKILNYIKENGIIQSELCKKLGYTQANLSRILNSDDIKVSQLEKICEALEVPILKFFDGAEIYSVSAVENLKQELEVLKKQVKHYSELYEDGKGETKNLIKMVKETFSIDPKISNEAMHSLKIITKFFDEDAPDGMKEM